MAFQSYLRLLSLLLLLGSFTTIIAVTQNHDQNASLFNRSNFPAGFIFGTASSSYQYEGAAKEGGRGPSIWDTYTHKYPDRIKDRSNGDVANDQYHHYKEDVRIMKKMGLDAYRFSISWSRVLPNGKVSGGVNREGIKYYNNLINELLKKGVKPFVTLFHWDLPQALEDEYDGFLSPLIVDDFRNYAELCFKEFGDRVKHWITLNEPTSYVAGGYTTGSSPPGRCSHWQNLNCTRGDSGREPYLVMHHQLLAHAAAVLVYKQEYQPRQRGTIGISIVAGWTLPYSNTKRDQHAKRRVLDFMFGWLMDPLTNGNYPHTMRSLVGSRLPNFKEEESKLVKGSFEFVGLNYYTTNYVANAPDQRNNIGRTSYLTDYGANLSSERNGIPIGPRAASFWLYVYPRGILDILLYTKKKYNNPLIYITENGIDEFNNGTLSLKEALMDHQRIDYYYSHLWYLSKAISDGVNVKGYFAWSLLDNFEWNDGYTVRFGRIKDHSNGDVAIDQYHHYKEDVGITKEMGLDAYRWKAKWGVNREGIKYYNNLINELLAKGRHSIHFFHLPIYQDYSEVCFKEFGDRVKYWMTLNEPTSYSRRQKGTIGISLVTGWVVPYSNARHNRNAALRGLDFRIGWLMDPLINGVYPHSMRFLVGDRLPKFTKKQSRLVKGSFDFIGLNYYTAYYATYAPHEPSAGRDSFLTDSHVNLSSERNRIPIGPQVRVHALKVNHIAV
ncbi:Beta-glucosidase 12 [Morella rubra]|uniref:Beta-glucosidase 12 n=1 Tax=Morella rubra TaxID=262757 RepID=A0A6A1UW24_9ROSI|nr:Beta-glucosidase 12 [Morella rubra]